nr:prepilin-type N-terminal cleavage/methylation domain-containing protein [Kiritimatiellia bacterium]
MPTSAVRIKKGFTLIEALIALLIIAILAALMGRILQGSLLSHRIQTQAHAESEESRREQNRQFAGEREEPVLTLDERLPLNP